NICVETLDIYAPLAYRLGLNMAYRELQNLAWKALFPWRFQVLTKAVNNIRQRYAGLIHTIEMQVQNACSAEGLEVKTFGREKSIYSIYSKMVGRNLTFAQINDVYGMRILVKSHIDCYTTLGLLHRIYKPLPGLFKDYTANPKPNGYQSLHTTVVVSSGFRIEIQIRTEDMHLVAESGAAAHWIYKNQNPGPNMATFKPIRSLMEIQEVTQDSGEFWLATKADLDIDDAADTVYVFTPRGKIVELPFGSTPIDFAYAIHRDMGSHVAAAKINNEPVLLNAKLNNGDVVEIETDPLACPQSSWLKIVATTRARQNIKSYINSLNQKEARNLGVILLSQALRAEGIRDLPDFYDANLPLWQELLQMSHRKSMPDILLGIGLGHESSLHYAKHIVTILSRLGVAPDTWLMHKARATWEHNMATESFMITNENFHTLQPAKCCYPILGDRVVCQFIRGQGLFIHNYQCKIIQNAQKKHPEQYISSLWDDDFVQEFKIPLVLEVKEAPGVLSFFTNQVNHCESEVYTASRDELVFQSSKEKFIQVKLMIGVYNLEHLQKVIKNLQSPNVKNIVARPEEDAINEVH
ncbi:MAG: TGS domain-containing protein, partial [Gammaproteobacteria bacterium]|nr:TGS domain-containing protein [Gammaproteobacteria bacterium]